VPARSRAAESDRMRRCRIRGWIITAAKVNQGDTRHGVFALVI
jgi:hypothetical protein